MSELKESRVTIMDRLEVGESTVFDVPRSSSISKAVATIQKKTGKHFTRKKVEEGVRVTRVVSPGEASGFAAEEPLLTVPPYEAAAEAPTEATPMPAPPLEIGEAE
jgi:hypothetical protein